MRTTRMALALVAVLVYTTGCTTAMLNLPGGASLMQPKDVTLEGLSYTDGKGATLTVQKYTSSANVAAVQAQTALVQGIVAEAVSAAVKAAVPAAAAGK